MGLAILLKATDVRGARIEAEQYAPCHLYGYYGADPEKVYMSFVREPGNKAHVATAYRNRAPKPNRFECEREAVAVVPAVLLSNEERGYLVALLEDDITTSKEFLADEPLPQRDIDDTNASIALATALIAKLPPI